MIKEPIRKTGEALGKIKEKLFSLVKQYLKKKAFFSIEEIVEYSFQRLKSGTDVNKRRLEKILKIFIKEKQIIPGTKLLRENILENSTREEIYSFILENASSNINEIMKSQNIGSNQALWHLDFLEKFQFIRSTNIGNQKLFFEFDMDSSYDEIQFYLKNEKIKNIISLMENHPSPFKTTNIKEKLKMNYNTVKKYLKILNDLNLVKVLKENNQSSYILDVANYHETLNKIKNF